MKATGTPADASTLIYLAKADAVGLAARCIGTLEVPPSAWREAAEARQEKYQQEVGRMRLGEQSGFLRRVPLTERIKRRAGEIAFRYHLGAGESEVLALGDPGSHVILDETRALRVAEELGLAPIRTLRIPLLGVSQGRLSGHAAMDMFHRLAVESNARTEIVVRLEHSLRRYLR